MSAKYPALLAAVLAAFYESHVALQAMRTATPDSAVLSAIIFNALVVIALVPPALRGIRTRAAPARNVVRTASVVYALYGLAAPFVAIKAIDLLLAAIGPA